MSDDMDIPLCRYGSDCYRKNPDHLKKFRHSTRKKNTTEEGNEESHKEEVPSKRQKVGNDETEKEDVQKKKEQKKDDDNDHSNAVASESRISPSYEDRKALIKQYTLFDMPDDFYAIWDLATSLNNKDPCNAFLETGLVLCGPFDMLAGKLDDLGQLNADDYLVHCRFYYDVPEFQTVFRKETVTGDDEASLFHIGYLRDEPNKDPIVCSNDGTDCKLTILGDNLFSALNDFTKSITTSSKTNGGKKLVDRIVTGAEKGGFSLDKSSAKVKERRKRIVTETFHGAGIVVKTDGGVGYRPLGITDNQLRETLHNLCEDGGSQQSRDRASSELQELITCVQFANDECDFGMGYELGIDLFCSGYKDMHQYVDQLLGVAYSLLQREQFKTILNAHLAKREKVPAVLNKVGN